MRNSNLALLGVDDPAQALHSSLNDTNAATEVLRCAVEPGAHVSQFL